MKTNINPYRNLLTLFAVENVTAVLTGEDVNQALAFGAQGRVKTCCFCKKIGRQPSRGTSAPTDAPQASTGVGSDHFPSPLLLCSSWDCGHTHSSLTLKGHVRGTPRFKQGAHCPGKAVSDIDCVKQRKALLFVLPKATWVGFLVLSTFCHSGKYNKTYT